MTADPGRGPLKLVILDLDGVVYRGDRPIAGAAELVRRIHDAGLVVRYATNNSMSTRTAFAARLGSLGIAAEAGEIVTSTSATVEHLRREPTRARRVLAVGAEGMVSELRADGYEVVPVGEAAAADDGRPLDVDLVVVGLDPQFDVARLNVAAAAVRAGARFVATNTDVRYPTPSGFRPGAGAMVAAVRNVTGHEPLVIGKPEPAMFEAILAATGARADEALVVGDNADADIAGARRVGIESVLVLTGVTDAAKAAALEGERVPDHVAADPAAVWDLIEARIRR